MGTFHAATSPAWWRCGRLCLPRSHPDPPFTGPSFPAFTPSSTSIGCHPLAVSSSLHIRILIDLSTALVLRTKPQSPASPAQRCLPNSRTSSRQLEWKKIPPTTSVRYTVQGLQYGCLAATPLYFLQTLRVAGFLFADLPGITGSSLPPVLLLAPSRATRLPLNFPIPISLRELPPSASTQRAYDRTICT